MKKTKAKKTKEPTMFFYRCNNCGATYRGLDYKPCENCGSIDVYKKEIK